jgi:acylglycerol lipase
MRRALITLLGLAALAAVGAAVAVHRGQAPVVGACAGDMPAGAFTAYRTAAADGNCLQGYLWAPPAGDVRGVLVVVHGLHDHARRYGSLAQALVPAGIAVLAQDHRGHGGSGGARQRLDSVEQLLGDVDTALAEARRRYPQQPLFLHGHSLGGMVVAQAVARPPAASTAVAGAVISSAALVMPPGVSGGQQKVVSLLSSLAPNLGLDEVKADTIVREASARAALAADPVIERAKLPARTVGTLLSGVASLQGRMGSIGTPLLILHGSADAVTAPAGSQRLHEQAASKDKTLRLVDGALHDLLHEPEGAALAREIAGFVTTRAAARPAG